MIRCEIKLDNDPPGIFYSGQVLTGRVELQLDQAHEIDSFTLIVAGFVQVKSNNVKKTKDVLRSTAALIKQKQMNGTIVFSGTYVYKFSTVLPQNLPASMVSQFGKILYSVTAELRHPWKPKQSFSTLFHVARIYDPVNIPFALKHPVRLQKTEKIGCFPCSNAVIGVTVSIPKIGYVAGETIQLAVSLDTNRNFNIDIVKTSLEQKHFLYSSFLENFKRTNVVVNQSVLRVDAKHCSQQIDIPQVYPSFTSKIMVIGYRLKVLVELKACEQLICFKVPIIIWAGDPWPSSYGPNQSVDAGLRVTLPLEATEDGASAIAESARAGDPWPSSFEPNQSVVSGLRVTLPLESTEEGATAITESARADDPWPSCYEPNQSQSMDLDSRIALPLEATEDATAINESLDNDDPPDYETVMKTNVVNIGLVTKVRD